MAETKRKMENFRKSVKSCRENGLGFSVTEKCSRSVISKISEILEENGWKLTAMQNSRKSQAKKEIKALKETGMSYQIFYNSEKPKQLAIMGISDKTDFEVELYFTILFDFY